ncbi:hypothetical protein XENTR_v10004743 [Xenopus tropicalis]|nr:hypothetical protein XENTR_v10004743 [Xenopus tropicalis]
MEKRQARVVAEQLEQIETKWSCTEAHLHLAGSRGNKGKRYSQITVTATIIYSILYSSDLNAVSVTAVNVSTISLNAGFDFFVLLNLKKTDFTH